MRRKKSAKDVMLPHSQAKVAFYREYLRRFLSIMSVSSHHHTVNIYDVFCGRGVYADGGHGSPIQAMEAIQEVRTNFPSQTVFRLYLNDKIKKHVLGVKEYISSHFNDDLCDVRYLNVPASRLFSELESHLRDTRFGEKNLIFIDPYGYKDIHKQTLENMLDNGQTEIVLFLPISFMHRFTHYAFDGQANKGALPLRDFISEFFSEDHPVRQESEIDVKSYIMHLRRAFAFDGKFFSTSYFIERDRHNYFAVFFITTNLLGLEKAVDAMWALDEAEGRGFHQKNDARLLRLFDDTIFLENKKKENFEHLRLIFLDRLSHKSLTNTEIYRLTLANGFLPKHAKDVLADLEKNELIVINAYSHNEKRRKGAFYVTHKDCLKLNNPKLIYQLRETTNTTEL